MTFLSVLYFSNFFLKFFIDWYINLRGSPDTFKLIIMMLGFNKRKREREREREREWSTKIHTINNMGLNNSLTCPWGFLDAPWVKEHNHVTDVSSLNS